MAKPRTCPNCFEVIPFGQGYYFDEHDNLMCENCGKIAYPVIAGAEPPPKPQQPLRKEYLPLKEPFGPLQDLDIYQ